VLTLPQGIERALQNNQRLLMAQEDIRISEQRLREAQSQYFPQLGLNFNSARYLAEQNYVMPPEFGSVLLRPSRGLEPDMFYSARAWLKQPLYSGGRTRNTIRLSRTNLERARIQYEEIRSRLVFDVTKAFYDVLLCQRKIQIRVEALNSLSALSLSVSSEDVRRRTELGVAQSRLRREIAERRRELESARLTFLSVLGVELYTQVGIQGELTALSFDMDLAKLLAWAQESRSEIRQTDFQQEMDKLAVNLSQAERFPVVAFGAAYELNDPEFPLKTTQWSAALNVSLPLFDGFSSRARIRQKRMQANQSRIRRAQIEDEVNLEVRESYADVVYWQNERLRREKELQEAESLTRGLENGKDAGDRLRAKTWLIELRESYWEAVHGQRVAAAKLQKAVGRPLGE